MKLIVKYNSGRGTAIIENDNINSRIWDAFIRQLSNIYPESEMKKMSHMIEMPWRYYMRCKDDTILNFCYYNDIELIITDDAKKQIDKKIDDDYDHSISLPKVNREDIRKVLKSKGFERELTSNQLDNLEKIINMPGAATFSVPGAGKTTEALAYFYYNANEEDKLIVVAPKNALISWDDELKACVPSCKDRFIRLQNGEDNISRQLSSKVRFMIITYDTIRSVKFAIYKFMIDNKCFMFLDESHKIKAGEKGKKGRVILDLSYMPAKKLIMSGTPMPQSTEDLVPQFKFLYPEKYVNPDNVVGLFQPIYVRTTADKLGIKPIKYVPHYVEMDELQRNVYECLKSAEKRELELNNVSDYSRDSLKRLGKSVMKVLQFVSNPALMATDMAITFNPDMAKVMLENDGAKLKKTIDLVRELAKKEKVIVWTTFRQNIQILNMRLSDLGANYIDGTVVTGDSNDPATREYRIKQFKTNPNCKVLIANPAACSESISLHTVCHHAIYMDRSFNVAHFLQSEDRIHRLGLKEEPVVHIIECKNSVDQLVDKRLKEKISNMSEALNDPSIIINDYDIDVQDDEDIEMDGEKAEDGIDQSDYDDLLSFFFGK